MNINLIIKNIFFSFLTFFIFFEIIFFFLPVREPSNTIRQTENSILKLKPNYNYTYSSGPFFEIKAEKKTNNYGYNSNYDYRLNEADLLIVGDSFVEASEVANRETFHHLLNEKLNKNVYQLSHASSNLAQYFKFAEFGVEKFKPKIIIYNIVANDYVNSISGKYNFNLQNNQIFLKTSGTVKKKLIHKILLKSNFVRYLYYNLKPHHQVNYLLNMKNKKFEANIPCEYTNLELSENKQTFDLFLNYNKKFLDEGIKIILMFDPIRSKIYERNLNNCGFNDFESGLASKIREYSVNKIKPNGIYTLDLEAYFKSAYEKDAIKFEFENDLHWNKYTHNLVSDIIIEYLSNQLIKY